MEAAQREHSIRLQLTNRPQQFDLARLAYEIQHGQNIFRLNHPVDVVHIEKLQDARLLPHDVPQGFAGVPRCEVGYDRRGRFFALHLCHVVIIRKKPRRARYAIVDESEREVIERLAPVSVGDRQNVRAKELPHVPFACISQIYIQSFHSIENF